MDERLDSGGNPQPEVTLVVVHVFKRQLLDEVVTNDRGDGEPADLGLSQEGAALAEIQVRLENFVIKNDQDVALSQVLINLFPTFALDGFAGHALLESDHEVAGLFRVKVSKDAN